MRLYLSLVAVAAMIAPIVGLDIGHVLSRDTPSRRHDHEAVDEGAYAFCLLFTLTHGVDNLRVISRTNAGERFNRGGTAVWVTQFLRDGLGLPDLGLDFDHFRVCKTYNDKGPIAAEFGVVGFVDDRVDCLLSIHTHCPDATLFAYSNGPRGVSELSRRDAWYAPATFWRKLHYLEGGWRELARYYSLRGCDTPLWDDLIRRSPPNYPHSPETVDFAKRFLHELRGQRLVAPHDEQHVEEISDDDDDAGEFSAAPHQQLDDIPGGEDEEWWSAPTWRPANPYVDATALADNATGSAASADDAAGSSSSADNAADNAAGSSSSADNAADNAAGSSSSAANAADNASAESEAPRYAAVVKRRPHSETSQWTQKKFARAEAHYARKAAGIPEAPVLRPTEMCSVCGLGQPGNRCVFTCCTPCCPLSRWTEAGVKHTCPQHS